MDYQAAQTVAQGMTVGQLVAALLLGMAVAIGFTGIMLHIIKIMIRPFELLPEKLDTLTQNLIAVRESLWSYEEIDRAIEVKINTHDKDLTAHSVQKIK